MKTFYTYMWLREDGTPYYIGKGNGTRAFDSYGHRYNPPPTDQILVQEFPSESDAYEAEKFLIEFYGRKINGTGILRNLCAGGRGGPLGDDRTPAHREKLHAAIVESNKKRKGKKMPDGWLDKMQEGSRHMSMESRKRMWEGAAKRGRNNRGCKLSEEHKRKIGAWNKGKIQSLETIQRMTIAQRNRSPEWNAKIAAANRERAKKIKDENSISFQR